MKVKVLHMSVNPEYYDISSICKMGYDEALEFCKKDTINCMNWDEDFLKDNYEEVMYAPDGAFGGDGSDAAFVWMKVIRDDSFMTAEEVAEEVIRTYPEIVRRKMESASENHQSLYGEICDYLRDYYSGRCTLAARDTAARIIIGDAIVKGTGASKMTYNDKLQDSYENCVEKDGYEALDAFVDLLKDVFGQDGEDFEDDAHSVLLDAVMKLGKTYWNE